MAGVARVLPDNPALDKPFDYLVPEAMATRVGVGTVVRVDLGGRRVGGWVTAVGVEPPADVVLRPLARVTGHGPAPELIELAGWAAWRWAGRPAHLLRTASPPGAVSGLPPAPLPKPVSGDDELAAEALAHDLAVLRLPPAADRWPVIAAAASRGTTLVVCPSAAAAAALEARLRRAGAAVALLPRDWAAAAAGAQVVVGARAAAWGPAVDLAAVVVLDEHDEVHQQEASPTWHARDVAAERARRAGAACVWVSPCPSLEALGRAPLVRPARAIEREGWPVVEVVDRRTEDPLRADLYSSRLVDLCRAAEPGRGRTVCVLNRKGRARLLACAACGELARCEACGAAVGSTEAGTVSCRRCGTDRPALCLSCGGGRLKLLRIGVSRARQDLEALTGRPVAEVTGQSDEVPDVPVLVGTEAVLHRVASAAVVAFLDLDAELLAPRYRAAEEALALVARAARLVGAKAGGGRLVLQTRLPDHEVVQAALQADPERVATAESARRADLRFPPTVAMAHVSGPRAGAYAEALRGLTGLELLGPADGAWLVRAPDHRSLCDALASTPRPPGRLRVAVDPLRI